MIKFYMAITPSQHPTDDIVSKENEILMSESISLRANFDQIGEMRNSVERN